MRMTILKVILTLSIGIGTTVSFAANRPPVYVPSPMAYAIAKTEGFLMRGSKPSRLHNPGDIRRVYGYRFPGQVGIDSQGYVIFKDDASGWDALENQIRKMCGDSGIYSPHMTIEDVAKKYARDWRIWSINVAKELNCTPKRMIAELEGYEIER